jgi:hypothetical protein
MAGISRDKTTKYVPTGSALTANGMVDKLSQGASFPCTVSQTVSSCQFV